MGHRSGSVGASFVLRNPLGTLLFKAQAAGNSVKARL